MNNPSFILCKNTLLTLSLHGLLFSLALLLMACQGDPRQERISAGEAILNVGAEPRTMDPSLATDIASAKAILCFARGLTSLDDQGNPVPELAESWEVSQDGLIYDFKLRPAKWSNGERVTADDFLYTWTKRILNPNFGAEYAYQLFYIDGARQFFEKPDLDPGTVMVWALAPDRLRVKLIAPSPFFLQLTAHHSYFPVCRKVDEANPKWAQRPETYVGCGPYLLKQYQPGHQLVGEKNPQYWNAAAVALNKLTLTMIEQESTARIAFDNGELDATDSVPRPDLDGLKGTPELKFSPQFSTYFLFVNCQKPILNEPRVRRALALAIDRKAIVENVTRAGETPAFSVVPPALYQAPPAPAFQDAHFVEARKLLAEAGYPGGKGLPPLRYIYNTTEGHQKIAQVLQETWQRELGVQLSIENQEFKVTIENRRAGNFDIARAGWVADFKDPINFLEIFDSTSDNNDAHWADPRFDELLRKCRSEKDPKIRATLLKEADAYLTEQMPAIPLYIYTSPYLATPKLEGYSLNPMGLFDAAKLRWATKDKK